MFDALAAELPDDWFVYANLQFLERDEAAEGEADFLCVHRTHGMLLIECKGAGVSRDFDGVWRRQRGKDREPMRHGPMRQAQTGIKNLSAELGRRWARESGAARLPVITGHAVAFPLARAGDLNLPLNWQPELLFDCEALADIGARVAAALAFWRRAAPAFAAPPLSEFQRFRRRVLHPTLALVPSLGASLELDRQQMVRLSDEQRSMVEAFVDNPRVNVLGGAGTGKTVLAVEAACHLAEQGAHTLLLCFNRGLADHLHQVVRARSEPGASPWVTSFHALCFSAAGRLGRNLAVPPDRDAQREFWRVDAPLTLLEALEAGTLRRYDAVVVDEGQDFTADWWQVVDALLADPERGRRMVFYDPEQSIFGRKCSVPDAPTFKLTRNFRNTRAVADLLLRLSDAAHASHARAPEGEPPQLLEQPGPRDLRRMLDQRVTRLLNAGVRADDIVLLTPHSRRNSSLRDVSHIADVPLLDLNDRTAGALTHATITGFKGLEAEVVFLLDIQPDDPRCDRAARYVGASRARSLLYVFSKGRFDEAAAVAGPGVGEDVNAP